MASNASRLDAQAAAEKAVSVIGFGYDLYNDIRFSACKSGPDGSRLIRIDSNRSRDLVFPGGVVVKNVPASIKCDKGERTRFRSDVLSFNQMSEKFNREFSLSGKIPSGMFNAMFDFKGCWQQDASSVKSLAYDGWFISLYNVELARAQLSLCDQLIREVPSCWDAAALAQFIENYGTHIVVGVMIGGKDVVNMKQFLNSNLQPAEVQKLLKQLADDKFGDDIRKTPLDHAEISGKLEEEHDAAWGHYSAYSASIRPPVVMLTKCEDVMSVSIRRGGIDVGQSHNKWLSTVSKAPNVISMSFVPITSLLSGVQGTGFLSHAVNLYLRYKPPIEELHQFLEFQLPRQWAPVYGDLQLCLRHRKQGSPALKFSLMGPKLYVNTAKVDSENRPVTGIRLFLEGKKGDHLAIHLQHLSTCPPVFQLSDDLSYVPNDGVNERSYYEPVKWSIFSHVCTAPVQYHADDLASIVTKAWLEVKGVGVKKVLFLRLGFSAVASAKIRSFTWDNLNTNSRKSGVFSMLSSRLSTGLSPQPETPAKIDMNSAIYPGGPPPVKVPKLLSFVDMKEMVRGPEDLPGHWVVTGARLCVENGKISIKAKYSLITMTSDESMLFETEHE